MLSFLSYKYDNSSKIEKALLKAKTREELLGASTETAIQKEPQKVEAEIHLKHVPMHGEVELAAVEDLL